MALDRQLRMAIVLAATDKMSRTVNAAFGNAQKKLDAFSQKADKVSNDAGRIARQSAIIGTAILAPLGLAAKSAIAFEDNMAQVAKVLDLQNGSKELAVIGNQVKDLSVVIGAMPNQAAELYANLAQGGAAKSELSKIAELAGKTGIAFDIGADLAGERFVKLQNTLQLTVQQTALVNDAINHLSNNTAAKASQIQGFFASGGGAAANAAKISGEAAAAIGSVYISMGKSGEEASTIFERMVKTLRNQNKMAGKVFTQAGGGVPGLLAAIEKGSKLKGAQRFAYFKQFGEYGVEVEQLANNMGMLQKHLGMVAQKTTFAGSVQKEFENRINTTAFRLKQAQANAQIFAIEVGTTLLPVITDLLAQVTPVIKRFAEWTRANPELTAKIAKTTAVVGGSLLVISALSTTIAGVSAAISIATKVFGVLLPVLKHGVIIFRALGIAMAANPIGLIIAGVAALAAGFVYLWRNSEQFRGTLVGIWEMLKNVGDIIKNYVVNQAQALGKIMSGVATMNPFRIAEGVALASSSYSLAGQGIAGLGGDFSSGYEKGAAMRKVAPINKGGQTSVNFSPTINVNGATSMDKQQFMQTLKQYEFDLVRLLNEANRKQARTAY